MLTTEEEIVLINGFIEVYSIDMDWAGVGGSCKERSDLIAFILPKENLVSQTDFGKKSSIKHKVGKCTFCAGFRPFFSLDSFSLF